MGDGTERTAAWTDALSDRDGLLVLGHTSA